MEAKQLDQSKPMAKRTKTYHIPNEIPESELEECFLRIKSTFNDYGVSCTRDKRIITFLYIRRSLLPDIFGYRKRRTRNPAAINKASHLLRNYGPSLNEDSILKIPFSHFSDKKRVTKLQEAWPVVESALKKHGISCTLDLAERCMTVSTISSTMNPDNFDKARDVIELLSTTHAPPSMAIEILSGNMQHDLFKIGDQEGGLCSILAVKKEQYVKHWECLSCSLQALAEMGGCNLFLNENTLFAVGIRSQGLKVIRMVVERCIIDNLCPATVVINSKIILETCSPMDDFEDPHVKHMQMEKSGSSLNENGMLEFASFYTLLHESQGGMVPMGAKSEAHLTGSCTWCELSSFYHWKHYYCCGNFTRRFKEDQELCGRSFCQKPFKDGLKEDSNFLLTKRRRNRLSVQPFT